MSGVSLGEFFAMGGYGVYVWGSFGLSFIVFAGNIIASRRLRRRVLQEISQIKRTAPKHFTESSSKAASANAPKETS